MDSSHISSDNHLHPLEPLSAEEITFAVELLRKERDLGDQHRFVSVMLQEPPKQEVLDFGSNGSPAREAFAIVLDRSEGATYEALVSLSDAKVERWEHIPGVQPPVILEEFFECEETVKNSPEVQEALRKRGVNDFSGVMVDPWSAGNYGDEVGGRLARALVWVKVGDEHDNGYAHPVENLIVYVDLNQNKVVKIEDHGIIPIPEESGRYYPEDIGEMRSDIKSVEIVQPDGPSFEIEGHEVRWQKWRFRIGFTPREGLVLHTVGYQDNRGLRQILYRASLSEMVVPYGDTAPTHSRKNAFDAGEYNIGTLTNSLELGCDCLGAIRYFDAVFANGTGEPYTIRNAVCLHEEDYGILWKHTDFRTERVEVRRSRRLVISSIATVGNYEYGFFWYLYQDGKIGFEVKLTGILTTGVMAPSEKSKYGQLLNPEGLYAPVHQHFFNMRLDFDLDGQTNSIYEVHTEAGAPDDDNRLSNAFYAQASLLRTELEAQQMVDPLSARYWKVVNPSSTNRVGEPVGYKLVPHENVRSFAGPEASVTKRAHFITKSLWVTPYEQSELHAAGDYPNQHAGGDGLARWTSQDRSIENTDLVVWYTFGAHHIPRLEDWPVMPVQYYGFMIEPIGFFDRSPALDVPAPSMEHCEHHS
ncbi:MAG: primary-amine oxidase [Acidimicrobiia bacterium]